MRCLIKLVGTRFCASALANLSRWTCKSASLLTLFSFISSAQQPRQLNELTVEARSPMAEIGAQITRLDSVALKDNIAQSLADILEFNSSVFVKSQGRAQLSTVTFRGTSPGHTQVTWNGLSLNSPLMGTTDFSAIPAFFVDKADMLHGSTSVNEAGGALGGLVRLSTAPSRTELQYVQGIGSFRTFDEFLKFGYNTGKWQFSTRAAYSSSPNDYKYTNHDKKVNIYDDDHNIIGQYHPRERNRSGAFADLNLLQEVQFNSGRGDRVGISAWYVNSRRHLPLLTTDYGSTADFLNRQREQTLRAVISWNHSSAKWQTELRAGYIHTAHAYDYRREVAADHWVNMSRARSRVNTIHGHASAQFTPSARWQFHASLTTNQQMVLSRDKEVTLANGSHAFVGYDQARFELSAAASARWQPIDRLGFNAVLRQELCGTRLTPLIPALFIDGVLWPKANLTARASISRNHKSPSLNDLYMLPGGNANLRDEKGFTYDAGLAFNLRRTRWSFGASATWFDSRISDWIIWLPTPKGFFSPQNVKRVHSYGIESRADLLLSPGRGWLIDLSGSLSWTPSINVGQPMSAADQSIGKQLPYVPRLSASFVGRISWRHWTLAYKWNHYSRRFTQSSNAETLTGRLPAYYMSNLSLDKQLTFRPLDLNLKLAVNNLLNEDYLSVLSHPMPGINFEFFITLTPRIVSVTHREKSARDRRK